MNCPDVRPMLALLAYDDLSSEQVALVRQHLDGCPGCRDEFAALAHTRTALDAAPVPAVRVNVAQLFMVAAERQERRARRWRRVAVATAALAAALLVVVGLRIQIRIETHQVVIAWGQAPVSPERERPAIASPPGADAPISPELEERLRLLHDLTHALAADIDRRDRRRQAETAELAHNLESFQRVAAQKWAEAERFFSALYVAHFKPSDGGGKP